MEGARGDIYLVHSVVFIGHNNVRQWERGLREDIVTGEHSSDSNVFEIT